ncbi:MobC family plasmid mobilization relaxosome protein [Reichenbachiella ulvae]|uniref:MobC family plasmid mobilization relaxosome protein n=1 Tax=Reichenbachiella ulvae TaxID=2980104 RepID=A0ABT3CVD2_9BACT|nr:MobC family plasmid mobilization relaxosome protein [Reichenbachiella ulvae]MCV9387489.1 MobC family plasmid mobilization relaxosome protein [Reichenbachiella ulvae]
MARPKIKELEKKVMRKTFRCTLEDFAEINSYCEDRKLTLLQLVKLGMNKKIKEKPFPEFKAVKIELYRIGNNLNQISKALNSGNRAAKLMAVNRIKELKELKSLIENVNSKLK